MNKPKIKGTNFETEIVRYLNEHGFPQAERRALAGNLDKGDVAGVPGWILEAKACKRIALGEFMAEAEVEAKNADCSNYAVVVKRRMKNVSQAYAVVPLETLVELIVHDERRK